MHPNINFAVKVPTPQGLVQHHLGIAEQQETYEEWVIRSQAADQNIPFDIYHNTNVEPSYKFDRRSQGTPKDILIQAVKGNLIDVRFGDIHVAALGIFDDVIITVEHAVPAVLPGVMVIFENDRWSEMVVTFDDIIHRDRERDLVVLHCKSRQFRDIRKYLPLSTNWLPTISGATFVHAEDGLTRLDLVAVPAARTTKSGKFTPTFEVNTVLPGGSCGGVLIGVTSRQRPFIAAMHHLLVKDRQISLMIPLDRVIMNLGIHQSRARVWAPPRTNLSANGINLVKDRTFQQGSYNHKSYINYRSFDSNILEPLGTIEYPLLFPKTRIIPTPLAGMIQESTKVIPDMFVGTREGIYTNPFNDVVDSLADMRARYPRVLLVRAATTLRSRWKRIFADAKPAHPLTEETSLNGMNGVRFIDPLKRKTGRGLPQRGPKTSVICDDGTVRYYTQEAREHISKMACALSEHKNNGIVADICLKDEVKKPAKAVRGFAACPYGYNDLMRRLVLPVFKHIQENPILTGVAIGMDADSFQWKYMYLKHMARKNHVLYDFKNFDRSHDEEILREAHALLFDMMSWIFPEDALVEGFPWHAVAAGGFAIAASPVYNVQSTIYQAHGSLASGMFHTAMVNSLCQELILEMMWITFVERTGFPVNKNEDSFKKWCSNSMYGDDGFVSTDADGFDLPFFALVAKEWNLTITDPMKTDPNRKSFPLEMWSFLKRGFVPREDELGFYVEAPLELQSCVKTMNFWEPDDTMTECDAMIQRLNQCTMYLCSMRSEEAVTFYDECVKALKTLYGDQVEKAIWSFEFAFSKKADKLVSPKYTNPHNLADRAKTHPAIFEAQFYGKSFKISTDRPFDPCV